MLKNGGEKKYHETYNFISFAALINFRNSTTNVKRFFGYFLFIFFIAGGSVLAQSCSQKPQSSQKPTLVNKDCIDASLPTIEQQKKIAIEIKAEKKAKSIDSVFQHRVKLGFNGSLIIEQNGVVIYKNTTGVCNIKNKECISPKSTFQLASISKTFTGIAVLQLMEQGKIKLTDTIQKYIPHFPYKNITIENLLSHRSGLPNYLYSFEDKHRKNIEIPNNEMIMKWFAEAKPTPRPYGYPNRGFNYNNTNYIVLARIVEIITRQPFADYMREHLFLPLKMYSTFIDTHAPDSLLQTRTSGYDGKRLRVRDFYDGVYGDKGVFSTPEDLLRWYHALRSGCVVKKETLENAFTPRSLERRSRHNYGLGFRLMTNLHNMTNVHYVYHGGWWNGYSNMFWMDYKNDYVIIMLSNKRNYMSYQLKPLISILEDGNPSEYEEKLNN